MKPVPLPVIGFQPNGHETFLALLSLMVGTHVAITHYPNIYYTPNPELRISKGCICFVSDDMLAIEAEGLPKRFAGQGHDKSIPIESIRLIEVIK